MRAWPRLILAAAIGFLASPAAAQDGPVVYVGLFHLGDESRAIYSARRVGDRFDGRVFAEAASCAFGATDDDRWVPETASDVWRVSGRLVSKSDTGEAVVELDWRRTRTGGKPTEEPHGTPIVRLAVGSPARLDSVIVAGTCDPRTIALDVRYELPRSAAAQQTPPAVSPPATGGVGSTPKALPASSSYNVEMWLVHSVPNRPDDTELVTARLTTEGLTRVFSFRPVDIATPAGKISVGVYGLLRLIAPNATYRGYMLNADRQVTFTLPNGQLDDQTSPTRRGSAQASGVIPGPDAVIEFAMPPIEVLDGRPGVPDKFSIRMRIRPAQ